MFLRISTVQGIPGADLTCLEVLHSPIFAMSEVLLEVSAVSYFPGFEVRSVRFEMFEVRGFCVSRCPRCRTFHVSRCARCAPRCPGEVPRVLCFHVSRCCLLQAWRCPRCCSRCLRCHAFHISRCPVDVPFEVSEVSYFPRLGVC